MRFLSPVNILFEKKATTLKLVTIMTIRVPLYIKKLPVLVINIIWNNLRYGEVPELSLSKQLARAFVREMVLYANV